MDGLLPGGFRHNEQSLRTVDVLEKDDQRLQRVDGIGPKRAQWIRDAWKAQRAIREVMIFLQGHGVSSAYGARIFKTYGPASLDVMKNNPFLLARDISGMGFRTADSIAFKLGFDPHSDVRAEAGIYTKSNFPIEILFSQNWFCKFCN